MTPNIADIIRHHVGLEVRCIDRLYLHAYMPKLQTSGGLCYFLHDYLGHLCVARTGSAANRPGLTVICRRSRGFPGVNVTWATRVEPAGGRDHR